MRTCRPRIMKRSNNVYSVCVVERAEPIHWLSPFFSARTYRVKIAVRFYAHSVLFETANNKIITDIIHALTVLFVVNYAIIITDRGLRVIHRCCCKFYCLLNCHTLLNIVCPQTNIYIYKFIFIYCTHAYSIHNIM